jgi:hypothetical protein
MKHFLETSDNKRIALTEDEAKALERMLQFPEDLPAYDRLNSPTKLAEFDVLLDE